jgi:hypothetical protein
MSFTRPVVSALTCAVVALCAFATPASAAVYFVTNTNDSGPGSLRQGILDANSGACASPCFIGFNIPGAPGPDGTFVIQPLTTLPRITASNVTLDGLTQIVDSSSTDSRRRPDQGSQFW